MNKCLPLLILLLPLAAAAHVFTPDERNTINAQGRGDIMRLTTIATRPDAVLLRQRARKLRRNAVADTDFALLCKRMLATVNDPLDEGVGIAAPQVGVSVRLVAVQRYDKAGEPFEFFLNPRIVERSDSAVSDVEGCLSVPGPFATVWRSAWVRVRYRDASFRLREERLAGLTAIIMQHECDHLDGVLFSDKMVKGSEVFR